MIVRPSAAAHGDRPLGSNQQRRDEGDCVVDANHGNALNALQGVIAKNG